MKTEQKRAEMIKEISGVNPLKCMKCGKCSASCPSYNEMDIKPLSTISGHVSCTTKLNTYSHVNEIVCPNYYDRVLTIIKINREFLPEKSMISALRRVSVIAGVILFI